MKTTVFTCTLLIFTLANAAVPAQDNPSAGGQQTVVAVQPIELTNNSGVKFRKNRTSDHDLHAPRTPRTRVNQQPEAPHPDPKKPQYVET